MARTIVLTHIFIAVLATYAEALSSCPDKLPGRYPNPRSRSSLAKDSETEIFDDGERRYVGSKGGPPRIVGGDETDLSTNLPHHIVNLEIDGGGCTGSIINRKYILTAAHCAGPARLTDVYFYSSRTRAWTIRRRARRMMIHPDYNKQTDENDIMLIKLRGRAPPSAMFATLNRRGALPRRNAMARVAGFGDTVSDDQNNDGETLRQVDVPVRGRGSCNSLVDGYFHTSMLCAGYKCGGCDACQGDSGGPIFQFTKEGYLYQVGVTSFGLGCALPRNPGVYARVSTYVTWINNTMGPNQGFFTGGRSKQVKVGGNACP